MRKYITYPHVIAYKVYVSEAIYISTNSSTSLSPNNASTYLRMKLFPHQPLEAAIALKSYNPNFFNSLH